MIEGKTVQLASEPGGPVPMNPQAQAALQSLQNLQPTQGTGPQALPNSYAQNGRNTNGQAALKLNSERRENGNINGNARSPLADSFVL